MTTAPTTDTTELTPSYAIPAALLAIALFCLWLQPWVAGLVALFGLFLMYQTATLRLRFSDSALDVYRGSTRIRHFPYAEWEHWEIFWRPVPILFYFREVNSIHFLPMLFSAVELRACLEQHCPQSMDS